MGETSEATLSCINKMQSVPVFRMPK